MSTSSGRSDDIIHVIKRWASLCAGPPRARSGLFRACQPLSAPARPLHPSSENHVASEDGKGRAGALCFQPCRVCQLCPVRPGA